MQETTFLENRADLVKSCAELPFFKDLPTQYIQDVLRLSKIRRYDSGEPVIKEGELETWIYILLEGRVKIVKGERELAQLTDVGDIFGEMACITYDKRAASVIAIDQVVCLSFDSAFFDNLNPEIRNGVYAVLYRLLAEIIAHRLALADEEIVRLRDTNAKLSLQLSPI